MRLIQSAVTTKMLSLNIVSTFMHQNFVSKKQAYHLLKGYCNSKFQSTIAFDSALCTPYFTFGDISISGGKFGKFRTNKILTRNYSAAQTSSSTINNANNMPLYDMPNDSNNQGKSNENSDGTRKRRRVLTSKKDILTITPNALERIKYLLSRKEGAIGLAVGIRRRGCNGLSYTLDYVMEEPEPGKYEVVEHETVKVFVDQTALFYVLGTQMDFVENEVEAKFEWKNPKAKSLCGCGDSFNI